MIKEEVFVKLFDGGMCEKKNRPLMFGSTVGLGYFCPHSTQMMVFIYPTWAAMRDRFCRR